MTVTRLTHAVAALELTVILAVAHGSSHARLSTAGCCRASRSGLFAHLSPGMTDAAKRRPRRNGNRQDVSERKTSVSHRELKRTFKCRFPDTVFE